MLDKDEISLRLTALQMAANLPGLSGAAVVIREATKFLAFLKGQQSAKQD